MKELAQKKMFLPHSVTSYLEVLLVSYQDDSVFNQLRIGMWSLCVTPVWLERFYWAYKL